MMKRFFNLILTGALLALCAALLWRCDKDKIKEEEPEAKLDTQELVFDAAGDTLTVELRTNVNYDVIIPDSVKWVKWIQSATRAVRTDKLFFSVLKNESTKERATAVVVKDRDSDLTDTLHIRQAGIPPDKWEITADFDKAFAELLCRKGYIPDSARIMLADVQTIDTLDVRGTMENYKAGKGLTSLKGLEHFESLTKLYCYYNQLDTLDVSKNTALIKLYCDGNQLTSLNVSGCTALTSLSCGGNQLTSLDVSGCTALISLDCQQNQLTSLDISKNTALTSLYCGGNQLTSLDVSKNMALTTLSYAPNPGNEEGIFMIEVWNGYKNTIKFPSTSWTYNGKRIFVRVWNKEGIKEGDKDITADFDPAFAKVLQEGGYIPDSSRILVRDVKFIMQLGVNNRGLVSLKGLEHFESLTSLYCYSNQLTSLDISKNTALTSLSCSGNQLTSLNVSGCTALISLDCQRNQLTSLDISKNTALTSLSCSGNQLTSLNVSGCTALTSLSCGGNQLTSLTVDKALVQLICSNNPFTLLDVSHTDLTSLDVSKCTALTRLDCSNSRITSLNLNGCSALTSLDCSNSRLECLDVSGNTSLRELKCAGNPGNRSLFLLRVWQGENHTLSVDNEWVYEGVTVRLLREGERVANIGNGKTHGDVFTETVYGVEFKMVYVQGGTFTMGATEEQESDATGYEKPTHEVTLSDYYIGECEVTQGLWEKVMGTTLQQHSSGSSLYGVGSNYPMYYVSWNDIQTFLAKLNEKTGKKYALPTEAEWEYAARGGVKSKRYKYSGSNTIDDVAWYRDNSGSSTHPVKQKTPNELGLYDMSGNVWEWCQDRFDIYSRDSQTDPMGPVSGFYRVLRGGSWTYSAEYCRESYRFRATPDGRSNNYGFRVVLLP